MTPVAHVYSTFPLLHVSPIKTPDRNVIPINDIDAQADLIKKSNEINLNKYNIDNRYVNHITALAVKIEFISKSWKQISLIYCHGSKLTPVACYFKRKHLILPL